MVFILLEFAVLRLIVDVLCVLTLQGQVRFNDGDRLGQIELQQFQGKSFIHCEVPIFAPQTIYTMFCVSGLSHLFQFSHSAFLPSCVRKGERVCSEFSSFSSHLDH